MKPQLRHALEHSKYTVMITRSVEVTVLCLTRTVGYLFAKFDPSQSSRWSKVVSWPSSSISRRDEERPAITNDWLYFGVPFGTLTRKRWLRMGDNK